MGRETIDGMSIANSVFSTVYKTGQRFGVNYIVSILVSSKSQKVLKYSHEKLSSYGALKDYSFEQVRTWVRELLEKGYLEQVKKEEYPIVKLLDKSNAVQAGQEKVTLSEPDPNLAHKVTVPGESINKTLALYKEGKSVSEIASERGLAQGTILSHLAQAFQNGDLQIDINQFVELTKQEAIAQEFKKAGLDYLSPVKQSLGAAYSWEELKWVRAKLVREQAAV